MPFKDNPQMLVSLVIAIVVVIGAVFLQASTGDVPGWLITVISSIILYVTGVQTTSKKE